MNPEADYFAPNLLTITSQTLQTLNKPSRSVNIKEFEDI